MKIALIGYGKMGQLIEEIACGLNHEIVAKIDPHLELKEITEKTLNQADVCIDFSKPACFIENLKKLALLKKQVVAGTTGWYDQMDLVKTLVNDSGIGFIYASNFSIGVNIFLKIVEDATKTFNQFLSYDASGFEIHHKNKKDSPSGTAKSVASVILDKLDRKNNIVYDIVDRKIKDDELHYASIRAGANPGQHSVIFDSEEDTITLVHQARNRTGFAKGALIAAEFLQHKKGFYTINDLM